MYSLKKFSISLIPAYLLLLSTSTMANEIYQGTVKILGKDFAVKQELGSNLMNTGTIANTSVKVFGKSINLISAKSSYTSQDGAIKNQDAEFYMNGVKVYTQSIASGDGSILYGGIVPPTQLQSELFNYSIGIVNLTLNTGISYEAQLSAGISSPLLKGDLVSAILDPESRVVKSNVKVSTSANGFVEGSAKVLIARAGVGGSVGMISGSLGADAMIPIDQPQNLVLAYDAKISVLDGKVYGYLDYKSLFSWKRIANYNFYHTAGKCYALGAQSCN